ncbi:hypothetical protein J1N35_023883 [Gossypium stocksii]|uniref:T-complex protein 1 subunit theta n=1 Tax=Gossypium stocksii TaxID=47602 RepID=A0A9D3VKU1_9ROSI|nr:hypothetical protein J1N35_023883 [Gossypium stocksii]
MGSCIQVCPKNPVNFDVDNVRVSKLVEEVLHNCTVAVFATGVDSYATETKGTVLIHSAEQLENYAKIEEAKVDELIKAVADSGAKVIVSGGAVGEMALHFCDRYELMVLKISSKFERRFCRTTGIFALLKLSQPKPDDLGFVGSISGEQIGGSRVCLKRWLYLYLVHCPCLTLICLCQFSVAVDDGVNTYKAMCRDSRIVLGATAIEIELARRLKEFSFKETGLDQYAIAKFAESFELVPRTLAENARLNPVDIISKLYEKHASRNAKVGINLRGDDSEDGVYKDVSTVNVWDLYVTKFFARKYAADAACTVLRIDQIIMAKPA